MLNSSPKVYVIVPCYNEEDVVSHTLTKLSKKLSSMIESALISPQSGIVFVDDGSTDNTWKKMLCPPPR